MERRDWKGYVNRQVEFRILYQESPLTLVEAQVTFRNRIESAHGWSFCNTRDDEYDPAKGLDIAGKRAAIKLIRRLEEMDI